MSKPGTEALFTIVLRHFGGNRYKAQLWWRKNVAGWKPYRMVPIGKPSVLRTVIEDGLRATKGVRWKS